MRIKHQKFEKSVKKNSIWYQHSVKAENNDNNFELKKEMKTSNFESLNDIINSDKINPPLWKKSMAVKGHKKLSKVLLH